MGAAASYLAPPYVFSSTLFTLPVAQGGSARACTRPRQRPALFLIAQSRSLSD